MELSSLFPLSIQIEAIGNNWRARLPEHEIKASRNFQTILVGSLSPFGLESWFSQQTEKAHILSPADDYLMSPDSQGLDRPFGFTSGAAPLVTGALAGFEWAAGYHPTIYESRILLKETALPTLSMIQNLGNNQRAQKEEGAFSEEGPGLLNAYKLGAVGHRLREKCLGPQENGDPFCFSREIRNPETYHFPLFGPLEESYLMEDLSLTFPKLSSCRLFSSRKELAKSPEGESLSVFPSLQGESMESLQAQEGRRGFRKERVSSSPIFYNYSYGNPTSLEKWSEEDLICEKKAEVFSRLRRAVLLSSNRRDLTELLACVYEQAGFVQNAQGLTRIAMAMQIKDADLDSLRREFETALMNKRGMFWKRDAIRFGAEASNGHIMKTLSLLLNLYSYRDRLPELHSFLVELAQNKAVQSEKRIAKLVQKTISEIEDSQQTNLISRP